jgi:predicted NAD/FAD-binding protein
MRIAIIGGGISGMVAAYLLSDEHDIVLYESNDYIGGHTHTVDVKHDGNNHAVDTGFIVFNEVTYPKFCTLLKQLDVPYQPSTMTFSVKCERTGLEYSPHTLRTMFIQKKNIFSFSFYRMMYEIMRFKHNFGKLLKEEDEVSELVPYLKREGYSERFIHQFIIPLGSSLWSADPADIDSFPLRMFVRFFHNHGFLELKHPLSWKVIQGGSQQYVEKLTHPYRNKIRLNASVQGITRYDTHVEIAVNGKSERFDHVVIATHSDQALGILRDPSPAEREILGAIPYRENLALLHTDTGVLPEHRSIWSSWNYTILKENMSAAALTYDMNILQSISSPAEFCVSLNLEEKIEKSKVIGRYMYHHPIYPGHTLTTQKRYGEISGVNRTHYCGAYWGYGFHEDGVNSALAACNFFGKSL